MGNIYDRAITEYCERVGNVFYSEPLNLFSNLAFFISAFLIYRLFRKEKINLWEYNVLLALVVSIGIGSALWHSFRNPYTHILDAVPIYILILSLLLLVLKYLTNNTKKALVFIGGFLILQLLVSYLFPDLFNGSIRHLVNGAVFIGILLWIYRKFTYIDSDMILAILLYVVAIIFRSIDNLVCSYMPFGTHFLWHIFNSGAIYFGVKTVLNLRHLRKNIH